MSWKLNTKYKFLPEAFRVGDVNKRIRKIIESVGDGTFTVNNVNDDGAVKSITLSNGEVLNQKVAEKKYNFSEHDNFILFSFESKYLEEVCTVEQEKVKILIPVEVEGTLRIETDISTEAERLQLIDFLNYIKFK
ncbi:hypothetical protein CkP1_0007 [Citrobacter phage CkP1]|nr:hypothetical protein CkP1_0007 [Citrobacter phage CkP1]